MDKNEGNLTIDFEERSTFARVWSSLTKAVGEMAVISVIVPAVFRIFSKDFTIGEMVKHAWTGPTSWLTYGVIGITSALNFRRETEQDKATLNAHIENAIHNQQLVDAGQKPSEVTSITLYNAQHELAETNAVAQPTADTTIEIAHTQQALANVSHELEVVTNHAANLKAPTESHVEQAVIDKATAEQAVATIH